MDRETSMVSVIMPAYNIEEFIAQAIESVFLQNVLLELIVVNDASTDQTEKIVLNYIEDERLVYIKNSNKKGAAESRNIGVRKAKGKYIAFLDADDWWESNKLIRQLQVMKMHKAVLCYTGRRIYSHEGKDLHRIISTKETVTYRQLLHSNCITCSSVLMRREVALEFPMEHDEYHEDYMVWLKCLRKYHIAYGIDEPLLCYRLSKNGKSRNRLKSARMTYGMHRYMGKIPLQALYYTCCHLIRALWKYQRSWLFRTKTMDRDEEYGNEIENSGE